MPFDTTPSGSPSKAGPPARSGPGSCGPLDRPGSRVLRDEGEAYGARLRAAGVPVTAVRVQGGIHDFVMLNALRPAPGAQTAISRAAGAPRDALFPS